MPRDPSHPASSSALQERLSRLEKALLEGQERQTQAMEAWARKLGRLPTRKEQRRWEKRWRKQAKHAARRSEREARWAEQKAREEASRNPFLGWVYASGGLVTLLIALRYPRMWWLIFIAVFVFGRLAALQFFPRGIKPRGEREPAPLPEPSAEASPEEDVDPRMARVDALCDKLLAEVRGGPEVLREVVHAPEQTVEALRRSCHALARRERELRALCSPEDERRLAEERAALAARVEAETDAVVKERFASALAVLDEQRNERAELATAASRLEAEHTRLYYTLEHLYTQVLRVRSADAASEEVAGAGLRHSVEQLGAEMEAVTEALEEVHRAPGPRVPTR